MSERLCNQCGACCYSPTLMIRAYEWNNGPFSQANGWVIIDATRQGNFAIYFHGFCPQLTRNEDGTTACAIYSQRPTTCQTYPRNGDFKPESCTL